MKRILFLFIAAMLSFAAGTQTALWAEEELPAITLTIDPSKSYQTIRDFGASDCWTAELVGDCFLTSVKKKATRWLFSKETDRSGNPLGIGLSCWRVNLGAGSASQGSDSNISDETRRVECFLKEDGTYDWTRCDGQQWFMREAKDYGVEHFLLFSNSAPIYFTKNGKANANNQNTSCNLKNDCYDDFAEFLATTAKHFVDEGYNITYIAPVNEPRFDWKDGQEGSPWENGNISKLARELDKSIRSRSLSTKILLPEASSLDLLYGGSGRAANQLYSFFNTRSSTYIGSIESLAKAVTGHSYWTFRTNEELKSIREKVRDEARKYGVEVMQTEWSMLDAPPSTSAGFPASYEEASKMDIALYMGKLIYSDLTFGNMTGWSYWTTFAQERYSQKNRFYLIRVNASGDTGEESYGSLRNGGTLTADKNLWVLGNYSRFIRPGYKRIELVDDGDLNALLGSAWLSAEGDEIVAVLVNMKKAARKASFSLSAGSVESVKTYVTDKSRNLHYESGMTSTEGMEIPARSVVTVVMTLKETLGLQGITATNEDSDRIYDLNGQQVSSTQKGKVYIVSHKKVLIR